MDRALNDTFLELVFIYTAIKVINLVSCVCVWIIVIEMTLGIKVVIGVIEGFMRRSVCVIIAIIVIEIIISVIVVIVIFKLHYVSPKAVLYYSKFPRSMILHRHRKCH